MNFPKVNDKLAFFDYGQTLVAHAGEFSRALTGNYMKDCLDALTSLKKEQENSKPLPCMQWYANKLFENGYGIYALTDAIFNLQDAFRQMQLKQFYPNVPMTYFTVNIPEHKIDMIKAVALSEGCGLSDVIFVDDDMEMVTMALAAGMDAKHLSEIVVLYENHHVSTQQSSVLTLTGVTEEGYENTARVSEALSETISDNELNDILEDCRLLAERNGREIHMPEFSRLF